MDLEEKNKFFNLKTLSYISHDASCDTYFDEGAGQEDSSWSQSIGHSGADFRYIWRASEEDKRLQLNPPLDQLFEGIGEAYVLVTGMLAVVDLVVVVKIWRCSKDLEI